MSRYDMMMGSPVYLIAMISIGAIGVMFFGWVLFFRVVPRFFSVGHELDIVALSKLRLKGDIEKARSFGRVMLQIDLGMVLVGALIVFIGITGSGHQMIHLQVSSLIAMLLSLLTIWALVEYWFAVPGLLVVPEVRGTPGMWEVRRQRRRDGYVPPVVTGGEGEDEYLQQVRRLREDDNEVARTDDP